MSNAEFLKNLQVLDTCVTRDMLLIHFKTKLFASFKFHFEENGRSLTHEETKATLYITAPLYDFRQKVDGFLASYRCKLIRTSAGEETLEAVGLLKE
jgi:hypothetical protein